FDVFAGKKSAQIREILINESAWEDMTCLFAPSLSFYVLKNVSFSQRSAIMGQNTAIILIFMILIK
ncbi:hypothetical protein ABQ297_22305, partial [Enterobacter hormaechei]